MSVEVKACVTSYIQHCYVDVITYLTPQIDADSINIC